MLLIEELRCLKVHVWYLEDWKQYIDLNDERHLSGLRMHFDKEVNPTVRAFCLDFSQWLRKEFKFPLRLNVYVKKDYRIKAKDGDMVVGTMWRPIEYNVCPYIRIATGDYLELAERTGKENAMWAILTTFAHELTHYYQHINNLSLTQIGEERQATIYSDKILMEYERYRTTQGNNTKKTGDG